MFKKLFSVQTLLWLALLLALVGSLRHVAWGFSTLEGGDLAAGFVQAVAVDIGLFSLAIGIQQRRRQGRGTGVLWVGVLAFAMLSAYANLLHGITFRADIDLSKWTSNKMIMGWLDFLRPVLMSGVLPLLVVYLSEIAGSDVSYQLDLNAKERKRLEKAERQQASSTTGFESNLYTAERAREAKAVKDEQSREQCLDAMVDIYRDSPNARLTDVCTAIGRSKTTVYKYLDLLEQAGRVKRNGGDGIEVLWASPE